MSPNLKTSEGGCRLGRTLMSERELRRVGILARVKSGELKVADAARMLFVSYRQAKRLWRRYRDEGAAGLKHGSAGRTSHRAKPKKVRERALRLVRKKYSGAEGALSGVLAFPQVTDSLVSNLIRRGTNGFAFVAADSNGNPAVYLLTISIAAAAASNPIPQIGSISPSSTPQGSSELQVTLNGQGFVPGSNIQWNGTALQTTYVSSTILN